MAWVMKRIKMPITKGNARKPRPCGEVHGYGGLCEKCDQIRKENQKLAKKGIVSKDLRAWILARDNHVCAYCGGEAEIADHVIPTSKGGKGDPDNLVAACWSCNSRKRNRSVEWLIEQYPKLYGHLSQ